MSHIRKEIIPNLSIDCIIFGFEPSVLEVLLIKRKRNPHKGEWALPGGFIKKGEVIDTAAKRVLEETTGITNLYLEQIGVFDAPNRFPGKRVFTLGHFALVSPENYPVHTGIDTSEVKWVKLDSLTTLPFDHNNIIEAGLNKLRNTVRFHPVGFELLPKKFTLPQLQHLYECILGKKLDKRNFRKKTLQMNLLNKLEEKETNNKRRAAFLYKFDKRNYNKLVKEGFNFEL